MGICSFYNWSHLLLPALLPLLPAVLPEAVSVGLEGLSAFLDFNYPIPVGCKTAICVFADLGHLFIPFYF